MKLKPILILFLLFAVLTIVGCYTKLSYFEPMPVNKKHIQHGKETEESIEHDSHSEVEKDAGESDGYYGRRKSNYGYAKRDTHRSYTIPYTPYPYFHYPYAYYHPNPWYYGYQYWYYPPYYRYYRGFYPYSGRHYGSYYGRSYYPAYRGSTYKRGAISRGNRVESRRSRASRSVTSFNPRSERLRRSSQNRN